MNQVIQQVSGQALPLRGNDIDTDRIIPARYLKCVTFDGLGAFAFQDDRYDQAGNALNHPMNNTAYQGASILLVNKNFGCGSSREHAPQSLRRAGYDALIGESFAEIFFGNCLALGIPCVTMMEAELESLQNQIEKEPHLKLVLDLKTSTIEINGASFAVTMPASVQEQFLKGTWDVTDILLQDLDKAQKLAKDLPYMNWPTAQGGAS